MNGSQALVNALRDAGTDIIYSLSGNQIMPIYDACIDAGIRIVHTRHEAAAVYMAECHYQLTGKPAVAMVTAGPGFGNAVGAMFVAAESESGVLLLCGDSPVSQDGNGAFQELDQCAVAAPLVKHTQRVTSANAMHSAVTNALALAGSGRPGPCHLALAADALLEDVTDQTDSTGAFSSGSVDSTRMDAMLEQLVAASRPLVVTGPHLSRSREPQLTKALQQSLPCPLIHLESPRGMRDPELGQIATVFKEADVVLLLGKRVNYQCNPGLAPDAKWLSIDPDQDAIQRLKTLSSSAEALQGDARQAAARLSDKPTAPTTEQQAWHTRVNELLANRPPFRDELDRETLALVDVIHDEMNRHSRVSLVCDGGEFGQWTQSRPRHDKQFRITNGPSGAIGASIPYAIAASIAAPDPVVAVMGDGTAGFHFGELETVSREKLSIVVIIANDSRWNAEHQLQIKTFGPNRTYACELGKDVAYHKAAEGLGCHGVTVESAQEFSQVLASALQRAADKQGTTVINLTIPGASAPAFS